jgi:transposase-like protein
MRCPACEGLKTVTLDSRPTPTGGRLRRRKCMGCGARWKSTEETVEGSLLKLPLEPAWWAEARRLAAENVPEREIARQLGKRQSTVGNAINAAVRRKMIRKRRVERSTPEGRAVEAIKRKMRYQRARADAQN